MDGCHYDILDILTVVVIDTQEVIGGKIPTISAHGHTCILFPNGDLQSFLNPKSIFAIQYGSHHQLSFKLGGEFFRSCFK